MSDFATARESRQLSLAVVAERSGLTKRFISRVEREAASPSAASLVRICDAIGIALSGVVAKSKAVMMRAAERPHAVLPGNFVIDTLLTAPEDRKLTVIETVIGPEGSGGENLNSLPCDTEVCYVVEGEIELILDTDIYRLTAGTSDSITFDESLPHTWRSTHASSGFSHPGCPTHQIT